MIKNRVAWRAVFIAWLLMFQIVAADEVTPMWLNSVKVAPAGKFPLPRAEKAVYRGSWLGITSGSIETKLTLTKNTIHFQGHGETSGAARLIFKLDADINSSLNTKTFLPSKTLIVENYSDEKRKTWQTFDAAKVQRVRSTNPRQKDDGKEKTVHLPNIFDLPGSLLYIRSQLLRVGDRISFLVYATGSPYLATVTVEGVEKIKVPEGSHSAIRLNLHLQTIDKQLQLQPYAKASELKVWLSDDGNRHYLRFRGELFIGAALLELEKVERK